MNWNRRGKEIGKPLLEYLEDIIKEQHAGGIQLHVAVGTDSQRQSRGYKFATVILIRMSQDLGGGIKKGLGGKMIYATYSVPIYIKGKEGVNARMISEVEKSIETATIICGLLDKYGIKLEIHADINPNPKWESNKAMSAAVGWIMGMGYDFKIKPEAHAASFGADRFANNTYY